MIPGDLGGDREILTPVDSVPGISAVPHEENLRYFDVTIDGPDSSPYQGAPPLVDGA